MTRATFSTWLKDANFIEVIDDTFRIGVRNEYARDWLQNRLVETINRTLSAIVGRPVTTVYIVTPDVPLQRPLLPISGSNQPPSGIDWPAYQFDGFEATKANFVQIPHGLVDEVIPHVRASVGVLALVTFRRTVGIVIHQDGSRKKEWPTTYRHLMMATGIESINTARLAVWECRAIGLLVFREITDERERKQLVRQEQLNARQKSQVVFTLRPRWRGERIDYPDNLRHPTRLSKIDNLENDEVVKN